MALGLPCPESISSLRDHLSIAASALRPTVLGKIYRDGPWLVSSNLASCKRNRLVGEHNSNVTMITMVIV